MQDAVQLLIDTVGDDVYRFCCRLTRNRIDADDLYQDTFLKALEQRGRLEDVSGREQTESIRRNRNFLMGIAANLWKNQWRKKKREQTHISIEDTELFDLPSSDEEDLQVRLERKEIQQRLTYSHLAGKVKNGGLSVLCGRDADGRDCRDAAYPPGNGKKQAVSCESEIKK